MDIAKVTAKGQITLPKNIRDRLNLGVGDKVAFIEKNGAYILANTSSLVLKEKQIKANVDGVIASLAFEDIPVSKESIVYAENRLNGKMSHREHINKIKQKYSREIK